VFETVKKVLGFWVLNKSIAIVQKLSLLVNYDKIPIAHIQQFIHLIGSLPKLIAALCSVRFLPPNVWPFIFCMGYLKSC
jgi:uncharacterized membrane protein